MYEKSKRPEMVKYMQMDVDSASQFNEFIVDERIWFFYSYPFFSWKSCLYHALQTKQQHVYKRLEGARDECPFVTTSTFFKKKYENKNFSHSKKKEGENFALNIYEGAHAEINFCRSSKTDDSSP